MTNRDAQPTEPDHQPQLGGPAWRRPLLLSGALGLLGLGVVLNAESLGLAPEPAPREQAEQAKAEPVPRSKGEEGSMGQPMAKPTSHRNPDDFVVKTMLAPRSESDEDVWASLTGMEVGAAFGVGELGLVGTASVGCGVGSPDQGELTTTASDARSTFSIDVDTASYVRTRESLLFDARLPRPSEVRTEELINYFDYAYPRPQGEVPFSITSEVARSPWNSERRLVRIGLRGAEPVMTPPRNLVYLVDVSGSMAASNKLPLVKQALIALSEQLGPADRIALVTYAGASAIVLEPTPGDQQATIRAAIEQLGASGSTHASAGIEEAYGLAARNYVPGAVNRVIVATDGDFNVGVSSHDALIRLIEAKRESGVFLSVFGFGVRDADATMEQIADHGNGVYAIIDGDFEARRVVVEDANATLQTIAKDVKVQVEFDPEQVAAHRLIGYANRRLAHEDFADDSVDAGEIGAGHTVTALYEIEPTAAFGRGPIADIDLRYQLPETDRSELVHFEVVASERELADASEDLRFAAAVAAFGEALAERPLAADHAEILALAEGALGPDLDCTRHEFLRLVSQAGRLAGEQVPAVDHTCTPTPKWTSTRVSLVLGRAFATPAPTSMDAMTFVLEVLRLLPPLLALPLFVMAARGPRRSPTAGRRG